jgi:hypothetical protein
VATSLGLTLSILGELALPLRYKSIGVSAIRCLLIFNDQVLHGAAPSEKVAEPLKVDNTLRIAFYSKNRKLAGATPDSPSQKVCIFKTIEYAIAKGRSHSTSKSIAPLDY